jgi:hypothetical protein
MGVCHDEPIYVDVLLYVILYIVYPVDVKKSTKWRSWEQRTTSSFLILNQLEVKVKPS